MSEVKGFADPPLLGDDPSVKIVILPITSPMWLDSNPVKIVLLNMVLADATMSTIRFVVDTRLPPLRDRKKC